MPIREGAGTTAGFVNRVANDRTGAELRCDEHYKVVKSDRPRISFFESVKSVLMDWHIEHAAHRHDASVGIGGIGNLVSAYRGVSSLWASQSTALDAHDEQLHLRNGPYYWAGCAGTAYRPSFASAYVAEERWELLQEELRSEMISELRKLSRKEVDSAGCWADSLVLMVNLRASG